MAVLHQICFLRAGNHCPRCTYKFEKAKEQYQNRHLSNLCEVIHSPYGTSYNLPMGHHTSLQCGQNLAHEKMGWCLSKFQCCRQKSVAVPWKKTQVQSVPSQFRSGKPKETEALPIASGGERRGTSHLCPHQSAVCRRARAQRSHLALQCSDPRIAKGTSHHFSLAVPCHSAMDQRMELQ